MTLTGRVAIDEGTPMAGANLSLMLRFPDGFTRLQEISPPDGDGRFKVTAIPPVEQCTIRVAAPGYQRIERDVPWEESVDGPSELGSITLAKKVR